MIYFIQQGMQGPIKIGYSAEPAKRLANLATASSMELRLLATIDGSEAGEAALHKRFVKDRIRGEWFRSSKALVTYLRTILADDVEDPWPELIEPSDEAYTKTRKILDIEIHPPTKKGEGWMVRSRSQDLSCFEMTLEDALSEFVADYELSTSLGWEAIRFPDAK